MPRFYTGPLSVSQITAGPIYVGPGDIAGLTWIAFNGLRAFSSATRGNRAVNIKNNSGAGPATDLFTDPVTGNLVTAGIGPGTYLIQALYDQTGNGNDLNLAVNSVSLLLNILGGSTLPVINFDSVNNQILLQTVSAFSQAQPFAFSFVGLRTVVAGPHDTMLADRNVGLQLQQTNGGTFSLSSDFGTTSVTLPASVNTWHSIVGLFNGASSQIYLDAGASSATGNANTTAASSSQLSMGRNATTTNNFDGQSAEAGVFFATGGGAVTTPQMLNLTSNQKTYWGI